MYHYTKEQVQEFLGSKSNDINSLRQALKRRGFTVKTKQGNFILDKPMLCPIQQEFGFRPIRPNITRALLKTFYDFGGQLDMSWVEVANYIKETQGLDIHVPNLSTAYRELMANTDIEYRKYNSSQAIEGPTVAFTGHLLYFIIDKRTGQTVYIGITNDYGRRYKEHFITQSEVDKPLYKLFAQQGVENYTMEVRAQDEDREFIEKMERQLITHTPGLYNVVYKRVS